MKTYVCSDLHIGSECSDYPKIMKFFDLVKKDANELIMCGDILDLWVNNFQNISTQEPYKSAYLEILNTTNSISIPTIIVWGNHDINIAKYIKSPKIIISDDFVKNNIYFTHGWKFDMQQRIAYPFYQKIVEYFPQIYQTLFKTPSQIVNDPPAHQDLSIEIHNRARNFIEHNSYDFVIMGHTHDPFVDGKLIDCGDFSYHSTYVVIENGIPTLNVL